MVSENAEIDRRIKYINLADDIEPMVKFNPGIGLEAEPDRIRIQISLLGENGNPFELYRLLTRFIQSEDEILGKVKQMACYGIALLSRIPIIEKLRYNKKRDYSLLICEVRQKMSIFANEIFNMR